MRVEAELAGSWQNDLKTLKAVRRELNRMWSAPVTYTADATMTREHFAIILDGTSNSVDYTLLTPSDVEGMVVWIKCKDATSAVRAIGTIDWASNHSFATNESVILKSESNSWLIYGGYP